MDFNRCNRRNLGFILPSRAALRTFLKPILFSMDPELVHEMAIATLKTLSRLPWLLDLVPRPGDHRLGKELFGIRFPNPIGLAAGFDKNGHGASGLGGIGIRLHRDRNYHRARSDRESAPADFPNSRDGSLDQSTWDSTTKEPKKSACVSNNSDFHPLAENSGRHQYRKN